MERELAWAPVKYWLPESPPTRTHMHTHTCAHTHAYIHTTGSRLPAGSDQLHMGRGSVLASSGLRPARHVPVHSPGSRKPSWLAVLLIESSWPLIPSCR